MNIKDCEAQDDQVDAMLARLSSAMNIQPARAPERLSPERMAGAGLVGSCLSLDQQSDACADRSSMCASSGTMDERSTIALESPSSQPSSWNPSAKDPSDHAASRPPSRLETSRPSSRTTVRSTRASADAADGNTESGVARKAKKKREITAPWNKKKSGKKLSKTEVEKRQMEIDMWNAPDSTVLEHLLRNKGQVGKWQAVATARGLCSLSNNCRCPDCQSSYVTFDNDGDAGLGAGAPLYHIVAPACCIQ